MSEPQKVAVWVVFILLWFIWGMGPAYSHTNEEIEQWQESWEQEVLKSGMSVSLALEWVDWMERHPHLWAPPAPSQVNSRSTGGSGSKSAYRGMGGNWEQWRGLVSAYFPADQVDLAICVIRYESGGNPNAKNPNSSARGLFQVLGSLWAPHYGVSYSDLYHPETNVSIAVDIWSNYGWGAWAVYQKGKC